MVIRKYEVIIMDSLTSLIVIILVLILFAIIVKNMFYRPKKKNIQKGDIYMEPPRYYQQPNMNAQFNPYAMNIYYKPVHYPALRVISIVLEIFSFLMVVTGLIGAIVISKVEGDLWPFGILALVGAIVSAIILIAIAELVKVLADISISTRATLNQVIDATVRKPEPENKQ